MKLHANLFTIHPHSYKLASKAFSSHIQYGSLSHAVTLKMRSMSQKSSNKLHKNCVANLLIPLRQDADKHNLVKLKAVSVVP